MLIQAALNGARRPTEHPALPVTPEQLAREAKAAVAAGAGALHVHVRNPDGGESHAAADVAAALTALRAACPEVPVGISTGAWVVPDPHQRLELVRAWNVLPDFASANYHEEGSPQLAELLLERGIGVEAGVLNARAAETLVASGIADRCLRVLIELLDQDLARARADLAEIEAILDRAGVRAPRLLHGVGEPVWDLIRDAAGRGYDTRVGLEDTLLLPDGTEAGGNAALVAAARRIAEGKAAR